MNVWIAIRTDGVQGTGTQNDPFDGSTQAKLDALMNAMPMLVSISNSGSTATVTAINHGFSNGGSVLISGITGSDADEGTAAIVEGNRFLNATVSGPYHDTWGSKDVIVRNNYFRMIEIGPYQNMGNSSFFPTVVRLQEILHSCATR